MSRGAYRACGVHEGGCIECWGDFKAETSDAGWTNYDQGLLEPPAVSAVQVSVDGTTWDDGDPSACALTVEGAVECWGHPLRVGVAGFDAATFVDIAAGGRTPRWLGP